MIGGSKAFSASRIATDEWVNAAGLITMPHATSLASIDDLVFTVRLVKAKVKSKLSGDLAAIGLDSGKSFVTVDVGLAFAEQIQVGTVQHVDDTVHVGLRDQSCLMAAARQNCQFLEATELRGSIAHERRRSIPS